MWTKSREPRVPAAVGSAGGTTPNPTEEETCSGPTGHTEVVLVACPAGLAVEAKTAT